VTLSVPDIDPDGGVIAAALAYADAGWYVLPVDPGTKHAGSVLGKGWPAKSSRDPEQIVDWFMLEPHALALHVGRSGAVAFDVDDPAQLPPVLIEALGAAAPPHQSTRANVPGRGHYLFAMPPGRMFGNSAAGFEGGWGEVRGKNGIIIVSPSEHEKAAAGGRYTWLATGALPEVPETLTERLRDASDSADAATDDEVVAFLAEHTAAVRPALLKAVTARFVANVQALKSRHDSMLLPCVNAMREARAGLYPARQAAEALCALFTDATSRSRDGVERTLSASQARAEFGGILAWAVAQARMADDAAMTSVVDGIAERAPERTVADLIAPVAPPPTTLGTDGALATVHPLPAADEAPAERTSWWPRSLAGVLSGAEEEPPPSLLARADGVRLWYGGKVNGLLGESESGKTWVALLGVAQALADGRRVAYFDFEDTPAGIVSRLRALGVPDAHFSHLDYIGPDETLHLGARGDVTEYIAEQDPALVVIDGVNASMTLMGLDLNSNTDATRFTQTLLKPLAARGAAVVAVDHVPKSKESRGKGGIGAQAKRAMMTGCAITVEVAEPFGRGMTGRLRLYVDKDRPGFVRAECADAKFAGTAILESNASTGKVSVTIRPPQQNAADESESGPSKRVRALMEAVSVFLATGPERTSLRGIRDAVKGRPADVAEAVEELVRRGHVARERAGSGYGHTLVKPYSTLDEMIVQTPASTESDGNRGSEVVPGGSRAVSETQSDIEAVQPSKNGHSPQTRSGSVVPKWFPVVPGTTPPGPDESGSLVPTPLGGNQEPLRPGAPKQTANNADGGNRLVVIDGRIIDADAQAVLERHGDDLIDPRTGEVRGTTADLPGGAA
jgi:hypothetical protein